MEEYSKLISFIEYLDIKIVDRYELINGINDGSITDTYSNYENAQNELKCLAIVKNIMIIEDLNI